MVDFELLDDWGSLHIDPNGEIKTTTFLDREGPLGERGLVRVLAVDKGVPPKRSTATVVVKVTDVNDTPPRLVGHRVLHVSENVEATRLVYIFGGWRGVVYVGQHFLIFFCCCCLC